MKITDSEVNESQYFIKQFSSLLFHLRISTQ